MQKIVIGIVVFIAVIGGFIYLFLKPSAPSDVVSSNAEVNTPKVFSLVVANKKIVSGSGDITVNQGDVVTLHVTNDADEEVHLHGYNIMTDLSAGKMGTFTFTASSSGRFPFELEHSSTELGAISVLPR